MRTITTTPPIPGPADEGCRYLLVRFSDDGRLFIFVFVFILGIIIVRGPWEASC